METPLTSEATTSESWYAPLNNVTRLSKVLAAIVFITLPFVGFLVGYVQGASQYTEISIIGMFSSGPVAKPIEQYADSPEKKAMLDQLDEVSIPYRFDPKERDLTLHRGSATAYLRVNDYLTYDWGVHITKEDPQRIIEDFNNDQLNDVAVIVEHTGGGSGYLSVLAVFLNENGTLRYSGIEYLGDRIKVQKIAYISGEFVVDIITQGPGEGMCCGTTPATLKFRFENDTLVPV